MGAIAMSLKLSAASSSNLRRSRFSEASSDSRLPKSSTVNVSSASPRFEETKGRIAKVFEKNEIPISPYDTAWVGMVASPFSGAEPCFPDSLLWLLENQCDDGSWARPHHHSRLKKDVLSSTLASVLALKKWGIGQHHVDKGLHFLELNFGSATDESQITPMGFEIIFPAMLDQARAFSLNPALDQTTLNHVMNLRDLELKRINSSTDKEAYMAYIGEGLMGKMESKDIIMKYQRKNGSLFNSPSSTAAALIAFPNNSDCLNYLNLVSKRFEGAVPAVYPLDIYSKLCTVDNLKRLGISQYFVTEIQSVLDQTHRYWMQGDEEIFMDASTLALAFRTLRMNGYDVTSDAIAKVSVGGHNTDVRTILELYKASEVALHPDETDLERQNLRLRSILEHNQLSCASIQSSQLNAEVKQVLDYPFYAVLERMENRKNIENYKFDNTRVLKTSFCLPNLGNKDFLHLSVEDFNRCQTMHRQELREFERWVVENKLDELEFIWHKGVYSYYTAAATIFGAQSSDARMLWAKNALLLLIVDDFFDIRGSVQEMKKLIELVESWEVDVISTAEEEEEWGSHSQSHDVRIIFTALKSTICETCVEGSKLQGRSITTHVISIWLDLLHSFMKEGEWRENKYVPTLKEYMSNGCVSIGMGPIVLLPLYLLGPMISQEMVNHHVYRDLFRLLSTCGRLLNDIRGYEREAREGKVCAIPLYIAEKGGEMSTEGAISEIERLIDIHRKELLRLVLDTSVLPRECKELFWHMSSVLHLFYHKDDGYTSNELIRALDDIIHQPIVLEGF